MAGQFSYRLVCLTKEAVGKCLKNNWKNELGVHSKLYFNILSIMYFLLMTDVGVPAKKKKIRNQRPE